MTQEIGEGNGESFDIDSLTKAVSFLDSFGRPYCVHAGMALHLYGFDAELDDIDVKVFCDDLNDLYNTAKSFFDCEVNMIEDVTTRYFGLFMFPQRVEIETKTPIDICSHTGITNELGSIEFPYSPEFFKNVEYISYNGIKVPVAPLESVFLYYLVLRRDSRNGKDDLGKIKAILDSGKLNESKLFSLLENITVKAEIINLYNNLKNSFDRK